MNIIYGDKTFEVLAKYDYIITNSCTCTRYLDPETKEYIDDIYAKECCWELKKKGFKGTLVSRWGAKLWTMEYKIKQDYKWYGDLRKIAVITAGNDVWTGQEECEDLIDTLTKWNATVFCAVPRSTYIEAMKFEPNRKRIESKWQDVGVRLQYSRSIAYIKSNIEDFKLAQKWNDIWKEEDKKRKEMRINVENKWEGAIA